MIQQLRHLSHYETIYALENQKSGYRGPFRASRTIDR
jgi:hypothetical protein